MPSRGPGCQAPSVTPIPAFCLSCGGRLTPGLHYPASRRCDSCRDERASLRPELVAAARKAA
jgi:hypothetical protein